MYIEVFDKPHTYVTPLAGSKTHFEPFPLLFSMCLTGVLNKHSGTRTDVDQEFIIMFTLVDENQSWYLDENIRHFCTEPDSVDKEDAVFQRSNKMHGSVSHVTKHMPATSVYPVL